MGRTLRDFLPNMGKKQSYASGKAQAWRRSVTQPSSRVFLLMEGMIGTTVLHLVPVRHIYALGFNSQTDALNTFLAKGIECWPQS